MHSIENGQHREMAVDVPESFIAQNKTQPRYPPPRSLNNNNSTLPAVPPSSKTMMNDMRPVPPPRDHIRSDSVQQFQVNNQAGKIGQILEPTSDQMDSIKKYQDQLRQRREKEERIAVTNEFLRNSVRGSEKLRALKAEHIAPPPAGFDNEAYIIDDDDDVNKMNLIGNCLKKVGFF